MRILFRLVFVGFMFSTFIFSIDAGLEDHGKFVFLIAGMLVSGLLAYTTDSTSRQNSSNTWRGDDTPLIRGYGEKPGRSDYLFHRFEDSHNRFD